MGYAEENRQAAILNFLRQEKKASVADLSQMFEASEATIRRDLTKLENKGHLVKTYEGPCCPPRLSSSSAIMSAC